MKRRVFNAALVAASALSTLRAWADEPPQFDTLEFDWADQKRERAVPVRLYWPERGQRDDSATRRLLPRHRRFAPRLQLPRSALGEPWHRQPAPAACRQRSQPLVRQPTQPRRPFAGRGTGARGHRASTATWSFALDQLLASPVGRLSSTPERIVAAGHSYGANTTLLAAGARVERDGKRVDLREERLSAAVVLSAPPFYGEREPARILGPVQLPTLHITATGDVIRIPGYWSGAEDRIAVFEAIGSKHKALAVFEGGSRRHLHRPAGHRRH